MVPEVVVACLMEMASAKGTVGEVPLEKESGEGA
jgi:hypothetical protein